MNFITIEILIEWMELFGPEYNQIFRIIHHVLKVRFTTTFIYNSQSRTIIEIQDFSNVELRFLRGLVEEKNDDLFLVGDPYQKIYARKINFTAAGISVRGNRSKQLRIKGYHYPCPIITI